MGRASSSGRDHDSWTKYNDNGTLRLHYCWRSGPTQCKHFWSTHGHLECGMVAAYVAIRRRLLSIKRCSRWSGRTTKSLWASIVVFTLHLHDMFRGKCPRLTDNFCVLRISKHTRKFVKQIDRGHEARKSYHSQEPRSELTAVVVAEALDTMFVTIFGRATNEINTWLLQNRLWQTGTIMR